MSANIPTDICFSFTGLVRRGGDTGPHKDGWGVCFYEHQGIREFRDYRPAVESEIAQLIQKYPIKSKTVVCHIRQANMGQIALENTHPFTREFFARPWTYAHNGQLKEYAFNGKGIYRPVGTTDSEGLFCDLLNSLREKYPAGPEYSDSLWQTILSYCKAQMELGVFNMLLSQGDYLVCFCSNNLSWITRRAPFKQARLKDADVTVDFKTLTTEDDIVTVVATQPLTDNEQWNIMKPGEMRVFKNGLTVWHSE